MIHFVGSILSLRKAFKDDPLGSRLGKMNSIQNGSFTFFSIQSDRIAANRFEHWVDIHSQAKPNPIPSRQRNQVCSKMRNQWIVCCTGWLCGSGRFWDWVAINNKRRHHCTALTSIRKRRLCLSNANTNKNTKYKVQNIEYGHHCTGLNCIIIWKRRLCLSNANTNRNTKYKIQNTKYKIQSTKYKITAITAPSSIP